MIDVILRTILALGAILTVIVTYLIIITVREMDDGKEKHDGFCATCSACGAWSEYLTDYCGNCGAYMGDEEDG